ncbi:transcription-repair coupling factor [Nitrosophilus kaiyonis]|uniref:transcription-repair coupling factor n=1 Tax=Nitrosophilus kaiyonis TaxID=2930200 RepID=UPI002493AD58|nr:transcription-repair coupling factor [Nitrosophilus kaiyonis]
MLQAKVFEFLKKSIPNILVVKDEEEAKKVSDVATYLDINHIVLPDFRARFGDDLRSFKDELENLLSSLQKYFTSKSDFEQKTLLISPYQTLSNYMPSKKYFDKFKIEFGESIDLNRLKEKLLYWGYEFVDIVETKGEVSFRGDIIDIYPKDSKPIRISLFDEEVESIRYFDEVTQKSQKDELEEIIITPALFALEKKDYEELSKKVLEFNSDAFEKDIFSLGFWVLEEKINLLENKKAYFVNDIKDDIEALYSEDFEFVPRESFDIDILPENREYKDIEVIDINALLKTRENKKRVILAKNETAVRRSEIKDFNNLEFIYKDIILNIESDSELIVSLNKKAKFKKIKKSKIILDELKVGDYVVHENHGIGIFSGIEPITVLGATKDFVVLKYQGDDKLLVPVENIDLIDRYIADSGSLPVVDKLGSSSFSRLKKRVKEKLFEIANQIVKTAAQRELLKSAICDITNPEIKLFQKDAGFDYTPDQIKAIEDIFNDISSGKVMDRLLSGDVGFGKTEVAMNAIFAVVKSGYQAAFIAPTTLLSNQHYNTLKNRFEKFNIKVARLDRFVSSKEKKEVLNRLKEGDIDVIVGTHAIFGANFKNLALVIIDEEHKFGVKQKEKLKELTKNVHLLSMSATPIPRSLNIALSRLKDLSVLQTPPVEKKEVRTYVKEYNEKLIKEIILRELRRRGQIFYVFNSIANMENKKDEILKILPNLKILTLHSKVSATVTEKELLKFYMGEYDMLLSTSIVESGLHMTNVNTIIVDGADRFGMADLHQLRGRVGRGKREGYCYFLVESKEKITPGAKKRLIALETNSFLGSGQVLAMHDLEIRGGGNIIGAQQSGHIKNIGYSLYLKMLEDAINALTIGKIEEKPKVEIKLAVNAYLTKDLINEDRLRLDLYRRLGQCESVDEVYDIEEEIVDRFGKLDTISKQFIDIVIIKILALKKDIKSISNYNENITFEYSNGKKDFFKARSKDDDDIINTVLSKLRSDSKL